MFECKCAIPNEKKIIHDGRDAIECRCGAVRYSVHKERAMNPANIVTVGGHRINWDNVAHVNTAATWRNGDQDHSGVLIHFVGTKCLTLEGDAASEMLDWLEAKEIPF